MHKRIQFSLRFLLIATALIGIWAGLVARRINSANKEKTALQHLGEQWYLDLNCSLTTRFQDPQPSFWSSWILGEKWLSSESRTYRLGVHHPVEEANELGSKFLAAQANGLKPPTPLTNKSLKGLSAVSELGLLSIGLSYSDLSQSDFNEIGTLKHLEDLHFSSNAVVVTRSKIAEIGKLTSLVDLAFSSKEIETLAPLAKLTRLKYLSLSCRESSMPRLSCVKDMPDLVLLTLSGKISVDHIADLKHSPNLGDLDLSSTNADDSFADALLDLNLGSLYVGDNTITMETFNKLKTHIAEVTHGGLKDFKLSNNYFQRDNDCYELDLKKCKLRCGLVPQEDVVCWAIESSTTQLNAPYNFTQDLSSAQLRSTTNWKDLGGTQTSDAVDVETGNLYDGIHTVPVNYVLKFLSRDENRFHIQLNFENDWGYGVDSPCELNATLPFEEVVVCDVKSQQEANTLFAKHFDLSDFATAKKDEHGSFIFRLKIADKP